MVSHYVNGFKSKDASERERAVKDLTKYVKTELPEMNGEDINQFMDDFSKVIFDMISSDNNDLKKGATWAIIILVSAEFGLNSKNTQISRFANYLRSQAPTEPELMDLWAHAVSKVAKASGTSTDSYVEFEVKRALEGLSSEAKSSDGKRLLNLLLLKELATATPQAFFKQINDFYDLIFDAIRHPNVSIREKAIQALRAGLAVTVARESKESHNLQANYYQKCVEVSMESFRTVEGGTNQPVKGAVRDDRIHGSLLVFNELFRVCINPAVERVIQEVEERSLESEVDRTKLQMLIEWGTFAITRVHSSHGIRDLLTLVKHHKRIGTAPGCAPSARAEMTGESEMCRRVLREKKDQITRHVLSQRQSKSLPVIRTLLRLIPRMAAFDSPFSPLHLDDLFSWLIDRCRHSKSGQSFISLGLLSFAAKERIKRETHVQRILEVIKSALPVRVGGKKRQLLVDPVFSCISLLTRSVGCEIEEDVRGMLTQMMDSGLSPSLTSALTTISSEIPDLKRDIQSLLLQLLSSVLLKQDLRQPSYQGTSGVSGRTDHVELTVLALKVLGRFDFAGQSLMNFISCCSNDYIVSSYREIRLEAVKTCSSLLGQAIERSVMNGYHSPGLNRMTQDILRQLLTAAVTDSDPQVRYSVLASLDDRFDLHLSQAENLDALFLCLNDELFEIRELALCIIGRAGPNNPAYVMPPLRKVLLELLTDIEFSGAGRNREQSSKMLGHLISNAPTFIRPYTEPIIRVFIPRLKEIEPYPSVIISVLGAVGALAQVSGPEMRPWVNDLFPIILDVVQDSSSVPKREVGLWSLGEIVECTGCVIEPYKKYPTLMDILFGFLKSEQSQAIRRETIRVLGLLGAIDPYKHKINLGVIDQSGDSLIAIPDSASENQDMSAAELLVSMSSLYEDFYTAISIATLMRVSGSLSCSVVPFPVQWLIVGIFIWGLLVVFVDYWFFWWIISSF